MSHYSLRNLFIPSQWDWLYLSGITWPPEMKIKKKKKVLVVVAKWNHICGNIRSLIYSWPWISGSVGDYCTSPLPLTALLHRPALPEDDTTSPAVIAHLLGSLTSKKPAGISYSLSYYTSAGLRHSWDVRCRGSKMHHSRAELFPRAQSEQVYRIYLFHYFIIIIFFYWKTAFC